MDGINETFFGEYFAKSDRFGTYQPGEEAVIEQCFLYVEQRFNAMKYILGVGLDFILLSQLVRQVDPLLTSYNQSFSEKELFSRYPLVTARGTRQANTLTIKVNEEKYGIRALEERVRNYFYAQNKLGYPSAYVYNTGQWHKYKELLVDVFRLSPFGRFVLFEKLLSFGNVRIETITIKAIKAEDHGLFEIVIKNYNRSDAGENGGLAFQALAFGFVTQTYDHLNILADKVRSGSARQKRIGDIDGYFGESLVVTFEVKDISLNAENYLKEIGDFVNNVNAVGVLGVIVCKDCSLELENQFAGSTIRILQESKLLSIVAYWDSFCQGRAVEGMFHFLANVEHNQSAVRRLKNFVSEARQHGVESKE